jgi:site-specific DNA recombinase
MKARNPKVTPPCVVSGPTLLTGPIHCAKCGGAMIIRTGKGGRYRYCTGMTVPMKKLDTLLADHMKKRLLNPKRLEQVRSTVLDRRQDRSKRKQQHIAELN